MSRRRAPMPLALLAVLGVFIIAGTTYSAVRDAINSSHEAARLAERVQRLTLRIQTQRVQSILEACREQNRRHDALELYIAGLVEHPQPGQRRLPKKQRQAQVAGFVNAIAPLQSCAARVQRLAGTPKP